MSGRRRRAFKRDDASADPGPQRDDLAGGFAERAQIWNSGLSERFDLRLGPGGRVVIPAVLRKAMEVEEGDRLMAWVSDGALTLITPKMGVRRAQKLVRETIKSDESLVDSLIADRRWEAQKEMVDD